MSADPSRLADLVQELSRTLRQAHRDRLDPLGLTPAQGRTLVVLQRSGRPLRMAELAAALRIVPRSATGVVDLLEEAGLVSRTTDPASRRAVLVEPTPDGRALLADLAEARAAAAEELFAPLDAAERDTLLTLLERASDPAR